MYAKLRVSVAAALMLFLVVTWTRRCLDRPEPPRLVDTGVAADGAPPRARTRSLAPDAEVSQTALLTVRTSVLPAGSDLEWTVDLYLEPTPDRARELIASETRRGDDSISWDVPRGTLGVHVRAEGAVGRVWRRVVVADADAAPIDVELQETARAGGTVRGPDGEPLAGARVVFVTAGPSLPWEPEPMQLRDPRPRPALDAETDRDGSYIIDGIDPRVPYHGAAAAPGCAVRREYGIVFEPGALMQQDYSLGVACVVTGRLLDSTGRPIANAELSVATERRIGAAGVAWDAEGQAVTDANGRFRFDSLGAGRKSVQTVVAIAPGSTTVGLWECRMQLGDVRDLGELRIVPSVFEVRLCSPGGALPSPLPVRLAFFADRPGEEEAAVLVVPVELNDDGIVRVHGLGAGRVLGTVQAGPAEGDRWRPRTDWEVHFDGTAATVDWTLAAARDGRSPLLDARGRGIATLSLRTPANDENTLALAYVNDEFELLSRGSGCRIAIGVGIGDRVRVILTDGDRWGVKEYDVERSVTEDLEIVADRPGNTLEVLVVDGDRPVPSADVFLGPADAGGVVLFQYGTTGRDGLLVLRGVPPSVPLCVTASVFRNQPPVQNVEWVAGRARIVVDVGDR